MSSIYPFQINTSTQVQLDGNYPRYITKVALLDDISVINSTEVPITWDSSDSIEINFNNGFFLDESNLSGVYVQDSLNGRHTEVILHCGWDTNSNNARLIRIHHFDSGNFQKGTIYDLAKADDLSSVFGFSQELKYDCIIEQGDFFVASVMQDSSTTRTIKSSAAFISGSPTFIILRS